MNVDLSGLSCPLAVRIEVGDYNNETEVNEAIVNGKKPIPIKLLMGVKDSLRVDKSKFTRDMITGNITQVAVSGGFSVANVVDANLAVSGLDVNLASYKFTIPADKFIYTKGKFTSSKVLLPDGEIAAATFDFNKGAFTLTIKGTKITDGPGDAYFNMEFGEFNEGAEVLLP